MTPTQLTQAQSLQSEYEALPEYDGVNNTRIHQARIELLAYVLLCEIIKAEKV